MDGLAHLQEKDWRDPRLVLRQSLIHGIGHIATEPFNVGEVVMVFGGTLFSNQDIATGKANPHTLLQLDDDLWLGSVAEKPLDDDYYLNHSCDPNLWITDVLKLTARPKILPGEEVTMDYSTHFAHPSWTMKNPCNCGSKLCRGTITGNDRRRPDLQERYRGHFTSFLNKRISQPSE